MKIKYYSDIKEISQFFKGRDVEDEAIMTAILYHYFGDTCTADPEDIIKLLEKDYRTSDIMLDAIHNSLADMPTDVAHVVNCLGTVMTSWDVPFAERRHAADCLWTSLLCLAPPYVNVKEVYDEFNRLADDVETYSKDILSYEVYPRIQNMIEIMKGGKKA